MNTIDVAAYVKLENRVRELEAALNKLKGNAASSQMPVMFFAASPQTAGVGGVASFDFQNIPATFWKLVIELYARGDTAATSVNVLLTFNNDGSNLYDRITANIRHSATLTTGEGLAQASMQIGAVAAANAPANAFDLVSIEIPDYANPNGHKVCRSNFGSKLNTTTGNIYVSMASGWYRSTNPISRITLTPSAGAFAQYSAARLYGVY